jgi:hypothetical protein
MLKGQTTRLQDRQPSLKLRLATQDRQPSLKLRLTKPAFAEASADKASLR